MSGVPDIVLWAGLLIGLAFGATGQLSGFCLMSGLRGLWVDGDRRRIGAFALALAVAILGSQTLQALGYVNLNGSLYMQSSLPIPLLVLGGVLFGYDMVMANGCGARALVLLGNGNVRSFLVLLCLGIAAHMTLTGVIAPARVAAAAAVTAPVAVSPPTAWAWVATLGISADIARWIVAGALAALLALFAFSKTDFRASPGHIASGIVIGLLVPAGWFATGFLGADDFDPAPLASLTFVAPIGDTIQYAMLATGTRLSFGVTVVVGVLLGSVVAALSTRKVALEGFTRPWSMMRYMGGGALMGIGGALALGCSIGQGLTGMSTLAIGSFIAASSIVLGALIGLRGPLRLERPLP
jgi:uncharacterized protein